MPTTASFKRTIAVSAVDLFCGAGGLTHGLLQAKLPVNAGIDIDSSCKHPFEKNNGCSFLEWDIEETKVEQLEKLYPAGDARVLVGCAPCQPFSSYAQGDRGKKDEQWRLLRSFARIVLDLNRPESL